MQHSSGKKKDKSAAGASDQNVDLSPHPLVQALADEEGKLPAAVELVGYLGPSDRDDCVRLYLDLSFRSYYEIPKKGAVLYREPSDKSEEARPTRLIVRASAELKLVQIHVSEQAGAASFLQGKIRSAAPIEHLPGADLLSQGKVLCKPIPPSSFGT